MRKDLSFLDDPADFPASFPAWILDHVAVNVPQIPYSQISGAPLFIARFADPVNTSETTTSSTFGDLATVGPQLTALANGIYIILFGCRASVATESGSAEARMSVQVNSDTVETDAAVCADAKRSSIAMALSRTLAQTNNNTITAKYASADNSTTSTFVFRWLAALRIGN